MSGGHFDYKQYHIDDIAESIERYVNGVELSNSDVDEIVNCPYNDEDYKKYVRDNHRTPPNLYEYSESTIAEMRKGLEILRKAAVYAQRIDWILSGDDGEDSFHKRLKEDLRNVNL